VFPDVEAMVVDVLRADTGLATATVSVYPPSGFDGTGRVVLVNRRGGAWISDLHIDQPLIELEVYGPDKTAAHVLANAARHALLGAAGTSYGTTTVTEVLEQDGPHWLPDYVYSGANRYVCLLKVFMTTV
jgi:hypothetical protein